MTQSDFPDSRRQARVWQRRWASPAQLAVACLECNICGSKDRSRARDSVIIIIAVLVVVYACACTSLFLSFSLALSLSSVIDSFLSLAVEPGNLDGDGLEFGDDVVHQSVGVP